MPYKRTPLPVETTKDGVVIIIDPQPERPVSARIHGDGGFDLYLEKTSGPLQFRVDGGTALSAIKNGMPVAACETDEDGPARFTVLDLTYAEPAKESA